MKRNTALGATIAGKIVRTFQLIAVLGSALILMGCATTGADPTKVPVTTTAKVMGLTSEDFIGMGSKIARGILAVKQIELADPAHPPKVLFKPLTNSTRQTRLDVRNIVNNIEVELQSSTAGKVAIVDRSMMKELEEERDRKREGAVTSSSNPDLQEFAGVDFYLTGEITGQTDRDASGTINEYTLCTFRLVAARSGIRIWTGKYDISKIARDDIAHR